MSCRGTATRATWGFQWVLYQGIPFTMLLKRASCTLLILQQCISLWNYCRPSWLQAQHFEERDEPPPLRQPPAGALHLFRCQQWPRSSPGAFAQEPGVVGALPPA